MPVKAAAGGYGAHMDIMKEYQLIILAPQVASNYEDIKQDTDRLGIKLAKTQGAEYIKLTRDGQAALDFVQNNLKIKNRSFHMTKTLPEDFILVEQQQRIKQKVRQIRMVKVA